MFRRSLTLIQSGALKWCTGQRQFSITPQLLQGGSRKEADDDDDEVDEGPIKYSTSGAANWKAEDTFFPKPDYPPIQGPVVVLSIATFLMYFCVARDENDLDLQLYKPLDETVPNIPPPRYP